MARKTNCIINGYPYFKMKKVIGHDPITGKGIYKQFIGKSRKEAEEKYNAFLEKLKSGYTTDNLIFGKEASQFIYNVFAKDPKIKDTTKELYISAWNRIIVPSQIYIMYINDVSIELIQNTFNESNASYSARNAAHKLMRRFYSYLETSNKHKDITQSLVVYKNDTSTDADNPIITWSKDEIEAILNNFDKADSRFRFKFLVILAIYSGCRISELLALKYSDLSNGNITVRKQVAYKRTFSETENGKSKSELDITRPKTESSKRIIPIHPAIIKPFEEHKKWHTLEMERNGYYTDYIFTTSNGHLIDRHEVMRAMDRYYARIGIERKKFHAFRATFATNLASEGVPVHTVAKLLGHVNLDVTLQYYVNVPEENKAEAINKLHY